jgi:hypothetical protein
VTGEDRGSSMTAPAPEQKQEEASRGESLLRSGIEIILNSGASICVSGDCMSPLIPGASRVKVEVCSIDSIRSGDIVLMQKGKVFVLHRYIGKMASPNGLILLTKADKARRPDKPWPADALVGRLSHILTGDSWHEYAPGILCRISSFIYGMPWRLFLKAKGVTRS